MIGRPVDLITLTIRFRRIMIDLIVLLSVYCSCGRLAEDTGAPKTRPASATDKSR